MKSLLASILILLASITTVAYTRQKQYDTAEARLKDRYTVIKVTDGDTIHVKNGHEETVRIIGMNTPETVDPRKPVECFGKEASAKARELLEGKLVSLESDSTQGDKDRYGRILRYVYVDGQNFSKLMIEQGYAYEYTYSKPYKYQKEFKQAQGNAMKNKRGLWATESCLKG